VVGVVLWLLLIGWVTAEVAFYVIGLLLLMVLALCAAVVVGGSWLGWRVTGRWPSGRTIAALSGTALTLFLAYAAHGDRWVLLGGVLGTVIAAKTADAASGDDFRRDPLRRLPPPPQVTGWFEQDDL
jgi:hypothetical protein